MSNTELKNIKDAWLNLDVSSISANVGAPPLVARGETHNFNENVIIEYYSR